ncbi:hypothetical protein HNY73_017660 [Argiope bruennichi]|uniref:Uncharacterized protein n=1 Tax=Argiope bruennichi TaxID=94029 RepID=A0A8T0EBL1_ARGBR|nr:hypothetical protein HNY73_017660 [Argiope bruennichi]
MSSLRTARQKHSTAHVNDPKRVAAPNGAQLQLPLPYFKELMAAETAQACTGENFIFVQLAKQMVLLSLA